MLSLSVVSAFADELEKIADWTPPPGSRIKPATVSAVQRAHQDATVVSRPPVSPTAATQVRAAPPTPRPAATRASPVTAAKPAAGAMGQAASRLKGLRGAAGRVGLFALGGLSAAGAMGAMNARRQATPQQ